jgi:hypothetical protein
MSSRCDLHTSIVLSAATALLLVSCGGGGSSGSSADAGAGIPEGAAHFQARFAGAATPTGRLVGWNLGRGTYYGPAGDPFHPEWHTPENVLALAALRKIVAPGGPLPYVRFSGLQIDGSFGGDGYHFWDFARPDRTVAPTDNMAVFEYAAVASEVGGELTVTLDFGSGTSAEAARYVSYLNGTDASDPQVQARIASGRQQPYGVSIFEIGNEVYGTWNTGNGSQGQYSYANPSALNGGDPAWSGMPSSSPSAFAARALEYIRAVQAVAPQARFRVPLSQASMDAWGGPSASLAALAPLLREPAVDAVVVHFYAADDGITLGVPDVNAPAYVVAATEIFRSRFADLRQRLGALPRSTPLEIAVTEYHVADGLSQGKYHLGATAAVGLGIADMLVFFAQSGVEHACQHLSLSFSATRDLLVSAWYNPFRSDAAGGLRDMPSYVVTQMLTRHMLARRAALTLVRSPMSSYVLGGRSYPYARAHAAAFASADGKKGSVIVLNRDLQSALTMTVDLDDGFSAVAAERWAPAAFDEDATQNDIAVTSLPFRQQDRRVEIVVPPHSVAALDAARP